MKYKDANRGKSLTIKSYRDVWMSYVRKSKSPISRAFQILSFKSSGESSITPSKINLINHNLKSLKEGTNTWRPDYRYSRS